jgi:hypothetical protein
LGRVEKKNSSRKIAEMKKIEWLSSLPIGPNEKP